MSTHPHNWYTSEGYDGGLHHCRKCGLDHQGPRPETNDCPVSAEFGAVAWLGPAGLYRSRMEAVQNGEQCIEPVSANQLFSYARALVCLQIGESRKVRPERARTDEGGCKPDRSILHSSAPCDAVALGHSLGNAEDCRPDLKSSIHPEDMASITKWHSDFLQLADYDRLHDASAFQDKSYVLGRTRGQNDRLAQQLAAQATPTALMLAMENVAVKASVADHPPVFLPASVRLGPLVILGGVCLRVSYSGLKWYHEQLIEDRWEPLSVDEFEALLTDALRDSRVGNR